MKTKELKHLLSKMLSGIKVEISPEFRTELEAPYLGRWFFITAIYRNGNIDIETVKGGIPIKDINPSVLS